MPAATNIVINDGATTPVAHTFAPIGKDANGVMWYEQVLPAPASPLDAKRIGYKQIRGNDPKAKTNGVGKVIWTIALPRLETLGNNSAGFVPAPTVAYRTAVRIEYDLPERGLKQERTDITSFVRNLHANAAFASAVTDLQPIY